MKKQSSIDDVTCAESGRWFGKSCARKMRRSASSSGHKKGRTTHLEAWPDGRKHHLHTLSTLIRLCAKPNDGGDGWKQRPASALEPP